MTKCCGAQIFETTTTNQVLQLVGVDIYHTTTTGRLFLNLTAFPLGGKIMKVSSLRTQDGRVLLHCE